MKREEEMRAVFARFEESGQTLKAFGEREGISYTTLQYWRRKLAGKKGAKKPSPKAGKPTTLAPVRVVPDSRPPDVRPEPFAVWLSNGMSLEVPSGFDELDLRRLVGVLSEC